VVKNIVISQVNLLFIFAFFAFFYQSSILYEAFGFPKTGPKPILLGLIIVLQFLLQIYNTVSFVFNIQTYIELGSGTVVVSHFQTNLTSPNLNLTKCNTLGWISMTTC
jgi:hypothetical protein